MSIAWPRVDKPACSLGDSGRWEISVLGQVVRRHKLVFLYVYGHMPEQINHKNRILTDDRQYTSCYPIWRMGIGFEKNSGCKRMKVSRRNVGAGNRSRSWCGSLNPVG